MLFSNSKNINFNLLKVNIDCNDPGKNDPALIFPIKCVNTMPEPFVKFLGILIDPSLNFKSHIGYINKKIGKITLFPSYCKKCS